MRRSRRRREKGAGELRTCSHLLHEALTLGSSVTQLFLQLCLPLEAMSKLRLRGGELKLTAQSHLFDVLCCFRSHLVHLDAVIFHLFVKLHFEF